MSKAKVKIFSKEDRKQLKKQGISLSSAADQISSFKKGFFGVCLVRPCVVGDGILKLSFEEQTCAEKKFKTTAPKKRIIKFVPASGAASRMFQFIEDDNAKYDDLRTKFLKNLTAFPFYLQLSDCLKKQGYDLKKLRRKKDLTTISAALLSPEGLNYRNLPKGMIPFHQNGKASRTAFEEQLSEGLIFLNAKKQANIHFTLPETTRHLAKQHLKKAAAQIRKSKFNLSDSIQSSATDCLAAEENGNPARDENGKLVLRPAGHGALLQNLDSIKADLIYVKNIDNILPIEKRAESDRWKYILGGVFLDFQKRVFIAQQTLAKKKIVPEDLLFVLKMAHELGWNARGSLRGEARKSLNQFFNRPLRVCGMVPNSGEPGGGPFWAEDKTGRISLQIVESAEVQFHSEGQAKIWQFSTHFNPVDFICGVYDFRGKKYVLEKFKDSERGMISQKNYHGRKIKAMELPGLWNGAMSDWLSVFVEMPATIFVPVKTTLDLLRSEHQINK